MAQFALLARVFLGFAQDAQVDGLLVLYSTLFVLTMLSLPAFLTSRPRDGGGAFGICTNKG